MVNACIKSYGCVAKDGEPARRLLALEKVFFEDELPERTQNSC